MAFLILALGACDLSGGGAAQTAENQTDYVDYSEQSATSAEYLIFKDSFERESLNSDSTINQLFGYRGFIWDYGQPVIGTSGRDVKAVILDDQHWGEASDGNRALYFYGREGHSIHSIYLITKSYDLRGVDDLYIEFDYMTFRLNDPKDKVSEYLKLDMCIDSPDDCGVGTTMNYNKINGNSWVNLFDYSPQHNQVDQRFNGKNHKKEDWNHAYIHLDITQFQNKENFTFRFNARMTDGLLHNDPTKIFEDAAAIDNIRARAVDRFEEQDDPTGGGTGDEEDPDCALEGAIDLGNGVCIIEVL